MELSKKTKEYWQEEDWKDLEESKSLKDMRVIAKRILNRMPKPIVQVCGPIDGSGGLGSLEKNLEAFNMSIIELQKRGLNVFDQMPFEVPMQKLKKKVFNEVFVKDILDNFYIPIFESGIVSAFYFMPNWETSNGAKWEHEKAKSLGSKIVYM